jgi:hypothetical protein
MHNAGDRIGKGGQGKVFLAKKGDDGDIVALKVWLLNMSTNNDNSNYVRLHMYNFKLDNLHLFLD